MSTGDGCQLPNRLFFVNIFLLLFNKFSHPYSSFKVHILKLTDRHTSSVICDLYSHKGVKEKI